MLKNFKITIEYDGTDYHGWQRQSRDRTIQGEIEKALATMLKAPVTLTGSGRTDAGVHALCQVANFQCETGLSAEVFQKGLSSLLPDDIVITSCSDAADAFHARYDVKSKIYHYHIVNRPLAPAVGRQYIWHIRKKLDQKAMHKAIAYLIGTHDFKAFEGTGSPRSHTTRDVMHADLVEEDNGRLVFTIEANGFLRYMVRNIVGTLVDVGLGKLTPENFRQILQSMDRGRAGATAPAQGLFLVEVKY